MVYSSASITVQKRLDVPDRTSHNLRFTKLWGYTWENKPDAPGSGSEFAVSADGYGFFDPVDIVELGGLTSLNTDPRAH